MLSNERYLSRGDGNYYFDVYLFDNGFDNYNGTDGVYKKGTGFFDDKIVDIVKEHVFPDFFDAILGGGGYDVFHVYEIDQRTGAKNKKATLKYNDFKNYLLKNYLGWTNTNTANKCAKAASAQKGQIQQSSNNYVTEESVKQIVFLWNNYHNTKDIYNLSRLYSNIVDYYKSNYSPNKIIDSKNKLFEKYPDFKQEISNLSVESISNYYKISFDKTVWTDLQNAPKIYPSYLHVKMIDGSWKIVTESDLITDKNLNKKKK